MLGRSGTTRWGWLERCASCGGRVEAARGHARRWQRWGVRGPLRPRGARLDELRPWLFFQQVYNRSVEEEQPLPLKQEAKQWVRQMARVGAEERALLRVLRGHQDRVISMAFSSDGTWLLTGSNDKTVRLWEASSGQALLTLEGHQDWLRCVAFSPDSRLLVTADQAGCVYFWAGVGAECGRLLGMYLAAYPVLAIHWLGDQHLLLADLGGACHKQEVMVF